MLKISILFPGENSPQNHAAVRMEGDALPEYGQVWVWDMFYAQIAHGLAGSETLHALREDLELWGVNMSSKIFQPFEHIRSKGHLNLKPGFSLLNEFGEDAASKLVLEVVAAPKQMPKVRVAEGEDLDPELRAAAVVALGQYFIDQNELFAKELPLHILAFRKFYGDVAGPEESSSMEDAPLFAIQKALEYFNSVAQTTTH